MSIERWKSSHIPGASSLEHSFNTRFGMLSGPVAFDVTILSRSFRVPSTVIVSLSIGFSRYFDTFGF